MGSYLRGFFPAISRSESSVTLQLYVVIMHFPHPIMLCSKLFKIVPIMLIPSYALWFDRSLAYISKTCGFCAGHVPSYPGLSSQLFFAPFSTAVKKAARGGPGYEATGHVYSL